jgi:hypothetical protein
MSQPLMTLSFENLMVWMIFSAVGSVGSFALETGALKNVSYQEASTSITSIASSFFLPLQQKPFLHYF